MGERLARSLMPEPRRGGSKLYVSLGRDVSTFAFDVKLNKMKYVLMASANAASSAVLEVVRGRERGG